MRNQDKLQKYYHQVTRIILHRQHPASGLIPASVAVTLHGDYRDAWVRDNVYSILAAWGLALAYRRLDDDDGRAYELEHATIKCMRGLLFAMMRQAHKVELFKGTQALNQALHAKYNTTTGDTVVADDAWGHLQLDATSIFLLFVAQMTASGFHIVYTLDEVEFIQNLVFYIERAYRTPDYGVWERGNKINHGQPELNCSSIGMVVAALQAINGLNLFGSRGGPLSVIHCMPDEITRNYMTLCSALPRESPSKEIDAALLAVISFPAFAVADAALIEKTRHDIIKKYGCKRFLRDGHQTVLEDHNRMHYDAHELKIFEHVESEWPLFFTYLILDGLFFDIPDQVEKYSNLLEGVLVDSSTVDLYAESKTTNEGYESEGDQIHMQLVPELYIVPLESIEAERANPGSQERVPNQNIPLVWAQSLHILGGLIKDGLLSASDVDPLGRRLAPASSRNNADTVVQIVLLAENETLQSELLTYGLQTHTMVNCDPITISKPSALKDAYTFLGKNKKLNLSGRPDRPIGTLSTCKIYRCQGQLYAFFPHFMDREEFYLTSDNDYLISLFEQEVSFVKKNWMQTGRPTMCVMLTRQMFGNLQNVDAPRGSKDKAKRNLLNFFISIGSSGICHGTRVRVGRLSEMINTACVESLDFLAIPREGSQENWGDILSGNVNSKHKRYKMLKTAPDVELAAAKGMAIRTASCVDEQATSSKSPLVKSFGTCLSLEACSEPEHLGFELPSSLDPAGAAPSHGEDQMKSVNLALGKPEQTDRAIELLLSCTSLHDQMDILYYLYSCHGLEFIVAKMTTVKVLLEEVYGKATHFKQWSIVRQAAGILRKTVNFLSANLTDLLIRQKPVTVGIRPNEFFIDTPKNPAALAKIIFDQCKYDIREAPLIQEVITYLGQLVRASPAFFNGIMRIRTHFFVIAMREEISRSAKCSEAEAIERLMRLSPYETKSLLQQVLVAHDQVDSHSSTNIFSGSKDMSCGSAKARSSPPDYLKNEVFVTVQSGGFNAGNFAEIKAFNNGIELSHPLVPGRGLNMVVLSPNDASIMMTAQFDINASEKEANHLASHILALETGSIVLVAGKDDFVEMLTDSAIKALESIGSSQIRNANYRDSWCIVGVKGAEIGSVPEFHRPAHLGPTDKISKTFNLVEMRRKDSVKSSSYLPSNGWWLRRRRNDGALNRVPEGFYPKVWKVLSKTAGLQIGDAVLKSHPTISESTPEELNFALQIENLLDYFVDPAEHQIATECLVVIARIDERHPELTLQKSLINLKMIIEDSIRMFWEKWISENSNQTVVMPLISKTLQLVIDTASNTPLVHTAPVNVRKSAPLGLDSVRDLSREVGQMKSDDLTTLHSNLEQHNSSETNQEPDLSFEKNGRLARRIFYDLRQNGPEGTMAFLASACIKSAFKVST